MRPKASREKIRRSSSGRSWEFTGEQRATLEVVAIERHCLEQILIYTSPPFFCNVQYPKMSLEEETEIRNVQIEFEKIMKRSLKASNMKVC